MAEDYRVLLGVDLKVNDIRDRITQYNQNKNNAKLKLGIKLDTDDLKRQINQLNLGGTSNGKGIAIPINAKSLEDIKSIIADIKASLGTLDSKSGMKDLLSSINQIGSALDRVSNKFDGLNSELSALAKKDFSFNIGVKLGGSNSVGNNVAYGNIVKSEIIPELQRQERAIAEYLAKHYKTNELSAINKLAGNNLGGIGGIIGILDKLEQPVKKGDNLNDRMREFQDYFNIIKKAASLEGVDLSPVLSSFDKQSDELIRGAHDIKSGAKETKDSIIEFEEILKRAFGSGIDSEQLNGIVADLNEIKVTLKDLSQGISIDEITQSFRDLSNVVDVLTRNISVFKDVFGNIGSQLGLSVGGATQGLKGNTNVLEAFKHSLKNIGMGADEIDVVANRIKNLGVQIETLNQSKAINGGKEILTVDISGIDRMGNAVKLTQQYNAATGDLIKSVDKVSTVQQKAGASTNNFAKQQKQAVGNLTNQINQLNRAAKDQNASKAIKDTSHLETLKTKYNDIISAIQRMENASSDTFVDEQNNVKKLISEYQSLVRELRNAENVATSLRSKDIDTVKSTYDSKLDVLITKMKSSGVYTSGFESGAENLRSILSDATDASGLVKFLNGLDKLEAGYKRADAAVKEFNRSQKVGINVSGLQSKIADIQRISPEIDSFEAEINGAKVSVQSLLNDLGKVKTQGDFSVVNSKFKAFADAAKAAGIAITETVVKAKSIDDIKLDIELGTYGNQMSQMYDNLNKLSMETKELSNSVKATENAYNALLKSAQPINGVIDTDKLAQAQKEYASALEKTNNLLKIQAREERAAAIAQKLAQDKEALKLDTINWLKENTRAAKDYGSELRRLISLLDNVDDGVAFKNVARDIKNVQKAAKVAGKTGLTTFDKLISKVKEYTVYISAAEIFMYAEQAFREIFNTVKEIDTAMTGLYRVTDLTTAEYDTLFNNMINSAKEYGATLNDIINATTDWVRAGFEADIALGLAEVTTMYQHISDLDYNTASENLITAYNGFKDELNGAFDGDQVAAVNYIADIFNELDNNFAVTSAGLGEALTRSASALDLAGNTIQETAGMITGITEVTQDPEKAGSALKVLSLRLRGMKGQLEEIGEETDENVENISKMQGQILNMTGGKVNIFDASGNFKSTYEIMQGIANVWDELDSINQANLLETIAGKNRANDVAALLSNWENVEAAVKSASEAEGSASRENSKYVDSIQGRLDKLTTSWQSFANTFVSSDFLKGAVSALTKFVELMEKLVDNVGTLGTIGLGFGVFSLFKNRSSWSSALGSFKLAGQWIVNIITSSDTLSAKFKNLGRMAKTTGADIGGAFKGSFSAMAGAIGIAVAAIGLAINAYKNYREEISKARQETIQASDEFLDSAISFEKAYIKYSGKTNLTVEEEEELESAINGTVDALGDKSSALQNVVNSSNDYVASLERIKDAELEAANRAAKEKKENAKLELQDTVKGWLSTDGSEVNIELKRSSNRSIDYSEENEAIKIAKNIAGDYYNDKGRYGADNNGVIYALSISPDASVDEMLEYYHILEEIQDAYIDSGLVDSTEYEKVTKTIEKMSEAIEVYENSLYDAAKAQYQLDNGIPKTTEEFLKMRETILQSEGIKNASLDTKLSIANALDSEYSQIFDLSSAKVQARKFIGLIKGYGNGTKDGTNEIGTVETFLNMRTMVNNNEVPVGKYLAQFNEINKMTENWSDEEKELLTTSLGLDTDTIKEQYAELEKYLYRLVPQKDIRNMSREDASAYKEQYRSNNTKEHKEIREFIDSLTSDELAAVIDIRTEIDWENTSVEDIRKQIADQVKLNEAMNFTIAIDVEAEGIEALNTALAESKSATGLATESISALKDRYKDLDGYNAATLFEETANGIRVNSTELAKLEEEYKDFNKQEADETLKVLKKEYDKLTDEIANCTDDQAKLNDLYSERDAILDKINDVASLAAQYEGLTSAYNEWQKAQEAGQDRDMYESIISGREEIQDEMSRGWLDDATVEYLELLTGKELSTAGIDAQIAAYKELSNTIGDSGYSIWDFFTEDEDGNATSDGVFNFFDTVKSVAGETAAWIDENGAYHFDFEGFEYEGEVGDAAIAKALGTSEELVQTILKAAEDAGFIINIKGDYTDLANMSDSIHDLNEQLKSVGATDYTFNVKATDLDYVKEQITEAQSALQYFENRDGKINLDDSDVRAAANILGTLVYRKSDLENPTLMSIDVSEPTTKLEEVLGLAQQLKDANANLEIQTAIGADTTDAQAEIDSLLSQISAEGYADIVADLSIDTTSVDSAIASINAISGDTMISLGLDTSKIEGYVADNKEATVTYNKDSTEVDEYDPPDFTRTVTFNVNSYNVDIYDPSNLTRTLTYKVKTEGEVSDANGTANANGTAFAKGNWGTDGSGSALGGELGTEILVRNGRWYTIGEHGAEFFQYKKGDIIFNHRQTEELFANGKVTSGGGRGRAFADGKAFAGSNAAGGIRGAIKDAVREGAKKGTKEAIKEASSKSGNSGVGSSGGNGSRNAIKEVTKENELKDTNTEKEFKEKFDWLDTLLSRLGRTIDNLDKTVNDTSKSWSERNKALEDELGTITTEISRQNVAKAKYMAEANKVGLSESWAKKVRDGTINISTITDENLADKIKEYQKWYDKALECEDAIQDLKQTESELYAQRFELVQSEYDSILQGFDHTESMLNEYISQAEAKGLVVSKKYYQELINNEHARISGLKGEQADLIAARDEAVNSGKIVKGSQAWYDMCADIDAVTQAIESGTTSIIEYGNAIRDIDWSAFDLSQDYISDVADEVDFLIDLMSNKDLYDDNGKFTSQGMSTSALHGTKYNIHMYQADDYGKQISEIDEQLADNPYDQELINRRRELIELQREHILAAEDEKNAIRDMVEEGIELEQDMVEEGIEAELDALQERIDKYQEALNSQKDLFDYQNKIKKQTEEIASIEKQMAAYNGDDSEEAKAKIQELKVSLEEAKTDLQETEYDRFISDQEKMLQSLYDRYEEIINVRLDDINASITNINVDDAVSNVINESNANAESILETITTEADEVGVTLSDALKSIWNGGEGSAKSVLSSYGDNFQKGLTTVNSTLNDIKSFVGRMAGASDKDAEVKVDEPKTQSSSVANPVKTSGNSNNNSTNNKVSSGGDGKAKIGDKVKFISGKYYYDSQGKTPAGSKYQGKQVYITNVNTKSWATHPYHISTGKKLGNGDLGWLKLNQISGYATGKKNFLNNEIAWTQENGQELIIRPSDGAILTPIAKGDSVLTSAASSNIWDMANSPAEFIKDNLNLGAANVPNNSNVQNHYVQNFENITFSMPNVRGYNELLREMQKDPKFEKLILSMTIDQIAGKSSLAKGKSIR